MRVVRRARQRGILILGALLLALAALALLAALVLGGMALWYAQDLPSLDKATDYRPRQHLQVLTADGAEIAQFGTERRLFVPLAATPKLPMVLANCLASTPCLP